jgi:hypothetical protein
MIANDDIKLILVKGNIVQIKMVFRQGRLQITGEVVNVFQLFESPVKALFGSDVQHIQFVAKEIRSLIQVEPKQAMPFQ